MGLPHLISIVGAGPGDPELLTVKALNRLEEADVILYDALLGEEILALANPAALKKYVGKTYNDGQNQTLRQESIHSEILSFAKEGKKVVRLKTGDPMVFARGVEEIRFCKANKLNFEVIPGVTAGLAASALFSVQLTERGKNNMVLFYTGTREEGGIYETEPIIPVLNAGSPVIIYMGLNLLPQLAGELVEKGVASSMPVMILCNISHAEQTGYKTTLSDISSFLEENKPASPSIIIIGENIEPV